MLLFKFRSLRNFEFTADILINERLYCAPHDKLNDPFEGLFSALTYFTGIAKPVVRSVVSPVVSPVIDGYWGNAIQSVADLPSIKNTRVCSLSAELSDIRMWSYYADSHAGCSIELSIDNCDILYPVTYSPTLRSLQSGLDGSSAAKEVLAFKTNHWMHEKEYRIISEQMYFDVKKAISAVYLGFRASPLHKQLILKLVGDHFPVYETKLNTSTVTIDKATRLN